MIEINPIDAQYARLLHYQLPTTHNSLPLNKVGEKQLTIEKSRLASFFPESLWQMSQQGEFRQVATVFISFQSMATQADLNTFVSDIIDTTNRFGGYFNKLDFGDKGNIMLICRRA